MAEESGDTQAVIMADGALSERVSGAHVAPGIATNSAASGHTPMDVSRDMMLLTWITFGILAIILYKIAWKPILKGLDQREETIRKSLDAAEKARAEVAAVEVRTRQMIAEAKAAGETIVSDARKSAVELANTIEKRAQEKTVAMTEEARREISAATDKARTVLRAESAELAIALAARIVGENMDSEKNRTLIKKLVSEN